MESFSLLKYWRGGGGATVAAAIRSSAATHGTDVATAVLRPSSATTDDGEGEDDGPFFDLEFAAFGAGDGSESKSRIEVEEGEFDIELKGAGGGGKLRAEGLSSSDDLFFKGKLAPLEPSSIAVADDKPQYEESVSLLKLAPKFRVFSLGYRKLKPAAAAEPNAAAHPAAAPPKQQPQQHQSKFFTRDRRARSSSTNRPSKTAATANTSATVQAAALEADEKRSAREVLQKYRNMIKPLYVRASRKHVEKHKVSGASSEGEPPEEQAPAKHAGGGKNLPAGTRVAGKRLGKSWQTSAAVAAVPSPPPPPQPQRRDDSLLELQDGIQSAIAHCKRSFTAPDKGSESPLARSKSEPIQATVD